MPANFDRLHRSLMENDRASRRRSLNAYQIDGRHLVGADGQRLLNFGSNDYLGLGLDRSVSQTSRQTNGELSGSTASALVCGWTDYHAKVAGLIAELESTESAVVFPSGFAACGGTVAALPGENDLILSDQLNHASIIDGCRLSAAAKHIYPHRDWRAVESLLIESRNQFDQVWIVTDAIFSMDGDIAPLAELTRIADSHECHLLIDEAHGTGVFGDTGSGICEELGLKESVPTRIGTLSKALGSQGGFVCGPKIVTDYLVNFCRPLVFSTSLSREAVATAIAALQHVRASDQRRKQVRHHARRLRENLGIEEASDTEMEVPIIPVVLGSDDAAITAARRLREQGFFVPAIRPPTVPDGQSRLRISLTAILQDDEVDAIADAVRDLC